ncbi:MAG TPA: DUF47 family protein [Solirubrobacteraceae bacterium]|jgi:uncharacterized protein Yka (UPF0111/DUF47 family)
MRIRRAVAATPVLDLFEEAGHNAAQTALLMRDMLADFPDNAALAQDILDREHEGDRLAHEILRYVAEHDGEGPLDSVDAHALTTALDDIVDFTEEAADRMVLYAVEAPMEQAEQMAGVLVESCAQVAEALAGLRAGADLAAHLVEIHRLENEGDRLVRSAIACLFATGIDPMTVIRWKDIFESLEQAVDACEKVAHVLEGVALKRPGLPG